MKWKFITKVKILEKEGWIFFVGGKIMVELKAVIQLEDVHLAQAIN